MLLFLSQSAVLQMYKNNLYMTSGFHHDINDVFVLLGCYAPLIGRQLPMLQDSVIGPEMSVSNHKSMCNIHKEERPHNKSFLGILQNILLFMFHGFMAHGRELMFKFCVEKSWV
jgi:hypothetical protein